MGIFIASLIILLWAGHLFYALSYADTDFSSVWFYVHILVQAYFYTGLFITGHDAMHGTVSENKNVNKFIGQLSSFLFAALSYKRLFKNHFLHHKYPGEEKDPDFYVRSQNFFMWWGAFLFRYTTVIQLILMGIIFNLLKLFFPEKNIIFFWVLPAVLSTFQLFFFGTFLPHRYPHLEEMRPHNARTQKKNHLRAMLSCYFFGYHYEHHDTPKTPWWQLYKVKGS